jgi:hypothetical protein
MSIQHIALVLEAADLCAQEKAVLIAFCNHTDPNGKTFAGQERLMREAGMPASTFKRWRRDLVERNLLLSKRKGRKGGGRTTSDTYVNLAALRAMRDPFFGEHVTDRPEDENPFADVNSQVTSNGPASEPKRGSTDVNSQVTSNGPASEPKGGNGPASGPINGPASEPTVGPPVSPITLPSPQGEPSTPSPAPTASAAPTVVAEREEGEGDPLLKNDTDPAAASMAQRLPGDMTQIQRQRTAARIAKLIGAGWGTATLERELTTDLGGVRSHFGVYKRRLDDLGGIAPVADVETTVVASATGSRIDTDLVDLRQDAMDAARGVAAPGSHALNGLGLWIKAASKSELSAFIADPSLTVLESAGREPSPIPVARAQAAFATLANSISA